MSKDGDGRESRDVFEDNSAPNVTFGFISSTELQNTMKSPFHEERNSPKQFSEQKFFSSPEINSLQSI